MKTLLTIAAGMLLATGSCTKETVTLNTVTVVRDCTGTYLRTEDGKDYNVCNLESVAPYAAGTKVKAEFKRISSCSAANERIVCYMLHANEGWIEVNYIR